MTGVYVASLTCSYIGDFIFQILHAAENKFERFRGFLELVSRFEFDFRRRGNFFEGFEFLVCSTFNHMQ